MVASHDQGKIFAITWLSFNPHFQHMKGAKLSHYKPETSRSIPYWGYFDSDRCEWVTISIIISSTPLPHQGPSSSRSVLCFLPINHPLRQGWREHWSVSSLIFSSITVSLNPPWCLGVRLWRLSGRKWPHVLLDERNICLPNHALRYDPRRLRVAVSIITHSGKPTLSAERDRDTLTWKVNFPQNSCFYVFYCLASLLLLRL